METYANVLLYAIPGFVVLILIEALYGHVKGFQTFRAMDTISSLSSGITNIVKDSLGLVLVLVSYPFLLANLSVFTIEATWLTYVIGFIVIDFAGYWIHRLDHSVNFFWNEHHVHHSSEEFNLACALRQSISKFFTFTALLYIPAAVVGVPHQVIAILAPLHLFAQFWYHTRHIGKMGWLEYILITPSQHRVHHAINPEYLDKNLGQIFSWWDRMFGTFQEELDDVPCVYGVTRPVRTWNPVKINFMHLWLLMKDAWRARSWWDKLRIWFMPLGWRPADVAEKYPIYKIENPYNFKKYDTDPSKLLQGWIWGQFVLNFLILMFLFGNFAEIKELGGITHLLIYGGFVFLGVYSYTALMDLDPLAPWVELIRSVIGLVWIFSTGDWFGFADKVPYGQFIVAVYFTLSMVGAFWMQQHENDYQRMHKTNTLATAS
ncbi:MAG TPA: sterol desaturase [Cytophagales bacterium]|nr:sterol desaturase [Cytophagales bacterium]HAA22264.1 sterol desaturase [Cytophagales bacterium]HAP59894.1 sterol desaturase [Cytophagales bacterium]